MSLRLVSSARNLREHLRGNSSQNLMASSGSSILSNSRTVDGASILSRQGTLLRNSSSNGNLRRSKSQNTLPNLSMEVTLLIVKRCIKEIRERGLTTKGILRQVHMAQSNKVTIDTIHLILDDDANTELSALRQVDIHLVAHAMKWAIRYSEETLVTYADYQALYLDQDRSFGRFVHDLPPTNRAILLDLFSLCADVTLLAHLNNMTLVAVAKAISLSIMAEPEREFKTFDASLQQRNMWGAASEDLLRAFLRIKTSYDLAKIEQEDEVDENRYVDNITRVVKSARQRSNDTGAMPNIPMSARTDVSAPSSAGWSSVMTPSGAYGRGGPQGYFDPSMTPRSTSPFSQQSSGYNSSSLSRSHSLAKSNSSRSRPISPAPYQEQDERLEYEELMQDQSHLVRLRQQQRQSQSLRPTVDQLRRRSSVAEMESLYMLPTDSSSTMDMDGYESEPEMSQQDHNQDYEEGQESLMPDFADGLGWDFSKISTLEQSDCDFAFGHTHSMDKNGVNRSNSSSSNGSSSSRGGHLHNPSPRTARNLSKQPSMRHHQLQDQYPALQRAHSQQESSTQYADSENPSSPLALHRASTTTNNRARVGHAISPSKSPQHSKRNSVLRRSVSLDPLSMHNRIHKKQGELRTDLLVRDLAHQSERNNVPEDIRARLLQAKSSRQDDASSIHSAFSLESSPQDLERPLIPTRNTSQGLGRSMSRAKLEINVDSLPATSSADTDAMSELTPVSNPSSNVSVTSPKVLQPHPSRAGIESHSGQGPTMDSATHAQPKKFEVVSRPKDIEVSVLFTPITPLSPKAELRSKFQESFCERPISPPPGYNQGQSIDMAMSHKRSPSGKSSKISPSSSTMSSPRPRKGVTINQAPLQQGVALSSTSSSTNEGKSKTAGFIRALSYKLRSKASEDQLRPVRINNQVVGNAVVPPSVSIQPPRLELSFLDGFAAPPGTSSSGTIASEDTLPPASAPAGSLDSWRRVAQESLPVSAQSGSDSLGFDRPKGFTGGRRSSGTLFGTGQISSREQRRKSRVIMNPTRSSPLADTSRKDGNGTVTGSSGRNRRPRPSERTNSDSSFTTDDDDVDASGSSVSAAARSQANQESQAAANASPKKTREREYRFSTATLLKDGKLYYQLQWDQFSELGFKSDFFHEPEQYLSGIHQKRMSRAGLGANSGSAVTGKGLQPSPLSSSRSTTSWDQPGHVGQAQESNSDGTDETEMDPGPSPAQRAAAMKAARESFMALAKDPRALAALKAGSTGGIGQATIIGTGSFPIGSAQPVLSRPSNLKWSSSVSTVNEVSPTPLTTPLNLKSNPYPSPAQSPSSHGAQPRSSASGDDVRGNHQRNLSVISSAASSMAGITEVSEQVEFTMEMSNSGQSAIIGGGAGSFASLPSPMPGKVESVHSQGNMTKGGFESVGSNAKGTMMATPAVAVPKPAKKSRLFGAKFRSSKKNNRLSASASSLAAATAAANQSNNNNNNNNKKERRLPVGVMRKDVMTKTEESLDEVFPWMCIEHMTGQESGWVIMEPVQDGAVGWVKIDKLEEEMARFAKMEQQQKQQQGQ